MIEHHKFDNYRFAVTPQKHLPDEEFALDELEPVTMFLYTSDGGPDQSYCKKLMSAISMPHPYVLFIPLVCVKHNLHLGVKSGLLLVDEFLKAQGKTFKYFGSMAKLSNCCRERSQYMFKAFVDVHDSGAALRHGSKVFPTCVSGRWGSITAAEEVVMRMGTTPAKRLKYFLPVLKQTLGIEDDPEPKGKGRGRGKGRQGRGRGGRGRGRGRAAAGAQAQADENALVNYDALDEIAIEETKAYTLKVGRWRREVVDAFSDMSMWCIMDIAHSARKPLDHALFFSQSEDSTYTLDLVLGKAIEIALEFKAMYEATM